MVIWDRVDKPAQAARAVLSYERIAQAALEIADSEGLDALTMRKVAARLGAGAMSLYRYVDSRDDLIDLMADQVYAEVIPPPPAGDWRADLAGVARANRQVALRHPWLAGYSSSMGGFGPNMLAMTEASLALLDSYGLRTDQMFEVWSTLQAFVQGYVLEEAARQEKQHRTGLSKEDWRRQFAPHLERIAASGRFPLVGRLLAGQDQAPDSDQLFERGLGYVLDGLSPVFRPVGH
jgi:AcrR family transcriptional regulator